MPPKILIAITGGVAAYKTASVVSQLSQEGMTCTVVMTGAATKFVGPATFAALSGRPVATDLFDPRHPLGAHIELAAQHDLMCVAPATAAWFSGAATGRSDDLISTLYLCFTGPVIAAPAMNCEMWQHPATQRNVQQVVDDGVTLVGPESGWLSCRQQGLGRMSEPDAIVAAIEQQVQTLKPDTTA